MISPTVWRLSESPFFKVRVTAPAASVQVMSKGLPAVIPSKLVLVNWTAQAGRAARRMVTKTFFILTVDDLY